MRVVGRATSPRFSCVGIRMIDVTSAWYLTYAAFGMITGWAVVSGLRHG